MSDSTIAAVSTPAGSGAIGIIKISGQKSIEIARKIFKKSEINRDSRFDFKERFLYHGNIIEPQTEKIIDEVLLTVMPAPHSYTKEDTVEINAHSGSMVLQTILDIVISCGAEPASPGEFTKRAFLNGRLDLTQAEAVIDIINAKTEKSLQSAAANIAGGLRVKIENIRTALLDILMQTEAAVDFPDETGDIIQQDVILEIISRDITAPLEQLIENYTAGRIIREGAKLGITGKPNVGKSSLMNSLLNKERSIVTSIPGTTRDLIEDVVNINGIPVIISDTAGIHNTSDPIETIGIKNTRECIRNCDIILLVTDSNAPLTNEDIEIYQSVKEKNPLLVINKTDLEKHKEFCIPKSWEKTPAVNISALHGSGISELKNLIAKTALGDSFIQSESEIIPNLRQKTAFENCLKYTQNIANGLKRKISPEFISIDINEAVSVLDEVLGISKKTDVLEKIFGNFCIGK